MTFREIPARTWAHAHRDPHAGHAYEVLVDGEVVGTVRSGSEESWRKHGRILTGFNGFARFWTAQRLDSPMEDVGYRFNTRRDAAEALVRDREGDQ